MDTTILLFAIFGVILWLDNKHRNARIKERWSSLGNKPQIIVQHKSAVRTTKKFTADDIAIVKDILESYKNPVVNPENKDISDETIDAVVDKRIAEEKQKDLFNVDKILASMVQEIDDAKMALKRLGYNKVHVDKAVEKVVINTYIFLTSEDIVKKALPILNN